VVSRALIRFSVFLLLVVEAAGVTAAEQVSAKHARVELLARQNLTAPGRELLLGVHFVLEQGWHIYWTNPGDSGQPPVFTWQLPSGFSAGEIQWPRPERMQSSPMLADYGYHDDVLLMVPVHAPQSLGGNARAEIGLEAKWLICREVCLPDHAQLHLSLPVWSAVTVNPATAAIFTGAQKLLPKPMPPGWKARAESAKDSFMLSIAAGKPVGKAEFFPLEPGQVENAAPQKLQPSARGGKITLKKSDLLLKPIAVLRGVLVLPGGDAYQVEAPVAAKQEQKKKKG